jgi:hypothetical protein
VKYSKGKGVHTGTPIRPEVLTGNRENGLKRFGFHDSLPVLMVVGGSSGAQAINECVREALPELTQTFQVLHLCGKGNLNSSLEGAQQGHLIGIFQFLECARRVNIVAWVYAHFLAVQRSHISHIRVEVNISHKRCLITVTFESVRDVFHIVCLSGALGGKPNQFAACVNDTLCLSGSAFGVVGVYRGHRLHSYRVFTANANISHSDIC